LREWCAMGGSANSARVLAILFLTIVLGAFGLPVSSGFFGEFLLLMGIYQYGFWYAVFGGLTIILAAVYLLRMYQKVMLGEVNAQTTGFADIKGTEWVGLVAVVVLVIGIGVYPRPFLDIYGLAGKWMVEKDSWIR